jgi:hypothetical protein
VKQVRPDSQPGGDKPPVPETGTPAEQESAKAGVHQAHRERMQPHHRDESTVDQSGERQSIIERAHRDVEHGIPDSGRSAPAGSANEVPSSRDNKHA